MSDITERITKKIASCGVYSRREAERLIFSNRVKVNGTLVINPAYKVSDNDKIEIDEELIKSDVYPKIYIYNKPVGVVTTSKDTHNRETIFQNIKKNYPLMNERLMYIGRLDINSSGLLLLTNYPKIASFLEKGKFDRVYKVRVSGKLSDNQIYEIKKGLVIDGIKYFGIKDVHNITAEFNKENRKNYWIEITLNEGKNREIRRIMNYLGFYVSKLIRIKYYKFKIGNIPTGRLIEVKEKETKKILDLINR